MGWAVSIGQFVEGSQRVEFATEDERWKSKVGVDGTIGRVRKAVESTNHSGDPVLNRFDEFFVPFSETGPNDVCVFQYRSSQGLVQL